MIDDGFGALEDAVGEPVVAHELPDVFLRIELGTLRREGDDSNVARDDELGRQVPAGPVEQQRGVPSRGDIGRDRCQMEVHRRGVAFGQDEPGSLALLGADGAEDIGRSGALVVGGRRPAAAQRPAAGDLVFLADPGLVSEPDLYVAGIECALARDRRQRLGPAFLKSSIAPDA